eukprot:superscaffoldBa00002838_g15423
MSAEASVGSHAADSAQSAVSQPACQNTDDLRNRGLLGSKYVKLNVGGSLHYTTVQTLSKEDSLLHSICNGGTEVTIDSEGWVVLDRCGRHFSLVLNFLRDGSVPLPEDHKELDEVLKEAQYYQVQGLVQHCLTAMQKQKDVFESVCRIPMITSVKEEQRMIATCRKPVVKLQNNRGNNKYSYTSNSDDNLLKNIELFDKLVLRFNGRVLFVKDVLGDEICCWSFYGEGRKIAEVCCTSIVYATEKKQTKVEFPEARIFEETLNILIYENGRGSGPGGLHLLDSRGSAPPPSKRAFTKARPRGAVLVPPSTLTLGILKQRYLAREGCETLSPEAKHFMKQVVKEELMKMQENDQNGCELETKMPQNKRKREKENDEVISEGEDESRAKKSRRQLNSSSESEDKEDRKTGSEESEEEEQIKTGSEDEEKEVKKSNEKSKRQINSEDSAGEEKNESETSGSERSCADSPKEKSDKNNENESAADSEKEEKVSVEKKTNESDSDSSSLPSLDEQDSGTENKKDTEKKKTVKTKESSKGQKEENKAVVRLKRYISLCGVRHNYKKLLQDCRSVRSMVAVLKRELEDLGVQGNPSIMKCKKIRMKREEARELAELDVSNIIATQGRPKRRGASAWQKQEDPPSSAYQRSLNSGSDSDQENTNRGRRRATDWSNLQGIISDDADSD